MWNGAGGFTTEIAMQGNTNAPATHHWNSDLRDLAVNFLVHFAMRLDRQISTLENCHLNDVCFFTYFDVGGSILQVRVSCGDHSPVELAKARIFCARRKQEKPKMPSVPFLHDVWMLLCSFLAYAKHHGHSPAKAESKKKHNQIKQQVRHGSPFKFTKSTTSKAPARRVLEVSNRNMSNVSNVWKFWPIRTDVVLQTSNPRHTVSPGSATEFAKLWTNHLR